MYKIYKILGDHKNYFGNYDVFGVTFSKYF